MFERSWVIGKYGKSAEKAYNNIILDRPGDPDP
jgi:hypothetical protein